MGLTSHEYLFPSCEYSKSPFDESSVATRSPSRVSQTWVWRVNTVYYPVVSTPDLGLASYQYLVCYLLLFSKSKNFRLCIEPPVEFSVSLSRFSVFLFFLPDRRWVPARGKLAGRTQVLLAVNNRIPAWFSKPDNHEGLRRIFIKCT